MPDSCQMALDITIGAALSGGSRSSLGAALSEMSQLAAGSIRLGSALDATSRELQSMSNNADDLLNSLNRVGQAADLLMPVRNAVNAASNLEYRIASTGITAGMTAASMQELRNRLRELAVPSATNQSVEQLERGFSRLVSAGTESGNALTALHGVGRTATATGASIDDLADTSHVLIDILGVAPGALTAELDRLAYAGNKGAFGIKDMVRYFPLLGAEASALKMRGSDAVATLAASLQTAMRGAAGPGEAARNTASFLRALSSPEALDRARRAGIDIQTVISDAIQAGRNPLESVLDAINVGTGGDPLRIGQIFSDAQARSFLKAVLADMNSLKSLTREAMTESGGTVDGQFIAILETFSEKRKGLDNALGMLNDSVGRSLLPPLGIAVSVLTPLVRLLADAAESSPLFTSFLVSWGSALALLPPILTMVGTAVRAMSASLLATPIGATIVLMALGAAYLIDHWTPVQEFFKGIWEPVKPHWEAFAGWIGGAWEQLSPMFETVGRWMGIGTAAVSAAPAGGPVAPGAGKTGVTGAGQPGAPLASMGAGAAAAEERGAAAGAQTAAQFGAQGVGLVRHTIELIVRGLPAGSSIDARSDSAAVTINAHTGPMMAGVN